MSATGTPLYDRISRLRRRFRPENRVARGLVDAAPLVDVALLLFLFFFVNSSFVIQPGIIVNLPESSFLSGARYGRTVVTISQEGMIFFNDERTTLEGLDSVLSQAVHDNPESTLIIEADGRVPHRKLIEIYNMAMEAGIQQVALGTRVSADHRATP